MKDPSYISIGSKRIHRAWLMLIACSCLGVGYFAVIFGTNGNFLVAITTDTGIARSQISIWQQVHYLSTAVFLPVFAKFYDRVNIRVMLTISACGCVLGALLMSFYTEWWQWIISGFLYGSIGAGLMYMPQAIILGNWFHKRNGFALGIALAVASLGVSLISPCIAVLIDNFGWRVTYVFQACIIAVLTIPFTLFVIVRNPSDINAKAYGYDAVDKGVKTSSEPRTVKGVPFKKGLFSIPFLMLFLFGGISALIGSGFDAHMPGYAVSIGFSTLVGSLLLSALFIGSCIEKLVMGWLNDRIGVQKTIYIELGLVMAGTLGLVFFRAEILVFCSTFIFGVQDSLLSLSLPLLVRYFFGDLDFTRLYAWASVGSGIVGSFGSPLVGLAFDLSGSYLPAFWVACGLCLLGTFLLSIAKLFKKNLIFTESPEGGVEVKQTI